MNASPAATAPTNARQPLAPITHEHAIDREAGTGRLERMAVRFAETSLVCGLAGLGLVAIMLVG